MESSDLMNPMLVIVTAVPVGGLVIIVLVCGLLYIIRYGLKLHYNLPSLPNDRNANSHTNAVVQGKRENICM